MDLYDAVRHVGGMMDTEALCRVKDIDQRTAISKAVSRRLELLQRQGVVFCVSYPNPNGDGPGDAHADKVKAILRVRQLTGWGLREANGFVLGKESVSPDRSVLDRLSREGWDIRTVSAIDEQRG